MPVIPTWAAENSHILPPQAVGYSIFVFFPSLKMGRLTFIQRPLPTCADPWLLQDALIAVEHTELWSLPLSELPPLEEGEPPREPLGIHGTLCCRCHLPSPTMHRAWELPVLFTSPSDAPLSKSCIQSSTLQAPAKDWMALSDPQGYPGPLVFVSFSITASMVAQWPSWTVFYSCFHLHCSPSPIKWTCQAESNVPCTFKGETLFMQSSSKEQDCFPYCQDHSFINSFFETILEHVSYQWSTPYVGRWGLVASHFPKVTLMWMQ